LVSTAQLVVLLPEVALDQLDRCQQAQDRGVAVAQAGAAGERAIGGKRGAGQRRGTRQPDALQERTAPNHAPPVGLKCVFRRGASIGRCRVLRLHAPFLSVLGLDEASQSGPEAGRLRQAVVNGFMQPDAPAR
jgi:hypothetical protein